MGFDPVRPYRPLHSVSVHPFVVMLQISCASSNLVVSDLAESDVAQIGVIGLLVKLIATRAHAIKLSPKPEVAIGCVTTKLAGSDVTDLSRKPR